MPTMFIFRYNKKMFKHICLELNSIRGQKGKVGIVLFVILQYFKTQHEWFNRKNLSVLLSSNTKVVNITTDCLTCHPFHQHFPVGAAAVERNFPFRFLFVIDIKLTPFLLPICWCYITTTKKYQILSHFLEAKLLSSQKPFVIQLFKVFCKYIKLREKKKKDIFCTCQGTKTGYRSQCSAIFHPGLWKLMNGSGRRGYDSYHNTISYLTSFYSQVFIC